MRGTHEAERGDGSGRQRCDRQLVGVSIHPHLSTSSRRNHLERRREKSACGFQPTWSMHAATGEEGGGPYCKRTYLRLSCTATLTQASTQLFPSAGQRRGPVHTHGFRGFACHRPDSRTRHRGTHTTSPDAPPTHAPNHSRACTHDLVHLPTAHLAACRLHPNRHTPPNQTPPLPAPP